MPERIFKSTSSMLGGDLILHGVYYIALGALWMYQEGRHKSMVAGWVDNLLIPGVQITWSHIFWAWMISGVVILLAGIFAKYKVVETIGVAVGIFVPTFIGVLVCGAMIDGVVGPGDINALAFIFSGLLLYRSATSYHRAMDVTEEEIETIRNRTTIV